MHKNVNQQPTEDPVPYSSCISFAFLVWHIDLGFKIEFLGFDDSKINCLLEILQMFLHFLLCWKETYLKQTNKKQINKTKN